LDLKILYRLGILREVIDAGSFTKAAENLGLSKSVISQHLTDLEKQLKVRLVSRSTRAVSLTEEGDPVFQCAGRILNDVRDTLASLEIHQDTPAGVIRLTASQNFAFHYLTGCISRFSELNPNISFDLVINDAIMNMIEERFDIGFRVGWIEDSDLHAIKICSFEMILCSTRKYLERHGPIRKPHDLSHHPWVGLTIFSDIRHVQLHSVSGEACQVTIVPKFQTNSGFTAKQLVADGSVIGLLPDYAVIEELANGTLVRILPQWRHRPGEISAIYVSRKQMPPRLRCFLDFLKNDVLEFFPSRS
jgi:DNA-binding transcriptional LysR family regulator